MTPRDPEPLSDTTQSVSGLPPATHESAETDVAPRRFTPIHPSTIPGYEIIRELGRGGMGVVYLARQETPNRLVAVKVVLAASMAGQQVLDRFRLEGETIARLNHPGIVQVYACGEAGGVPFLALEYIDGVSLDRLPPIADPAAVAKLIVRIARAIDHAHQKGVIHRDLKPANVLITNAGEPKVTDFGLAKFDPALAPTLDDLHATTRSGAILGSPRYMAPEQAAGRIRDIGPATDVHALGIILYELLTHRPAFQGESLLDTLDKIRTHDPESIVALNPTVARDLDTICRKCLEKDPAKRYRTAGDLADDLDRYLKHEPILARPIPLWERGGKWARRNPESAIIWGLISFLLPPAVMAVVMTTPLMGLFCVMNVPLGMFNWLQLTTRRRVGTMIACLILMSCQYLMVSDAILLSKVNMKAFSLGMSERPEQTISETMAEPLRLLRGTQPIVAYLLGTECAIIGWWQFRRRGASAMEVGLMACLSGTSGFLVVAVSAIVLGIWSVAIAWLAGGIFSLAALAGGYRYAHATAPALSKQSRHLESGQP